MTKDSWLKWRLTIVAGILLILSFLAMLLWREDLLGQAVAISLVSAGSVGILFDRLVKPGQDLQMRKVVRAELGKVSEIVGQQIRGAPSRYYEPAGDPDPVFNRHILECMRTSGQYLFQGVSGKYAAARLAYLTDKRGADIRFILIDPRDTPGVELRAKERLGDPHYPIMTLQAHVSTVKDEVRHTIVMLFDYRKSHDVQIYFAVGTALMTVEILDDAAFVRAWPERDRETFPPAYRYDSTSPIYRLFTNGFHAQLALCGAHLRVKDDWDDTHLIAGLREVGYASYDMMSLQADRAAVVDFQASLGAHGAALP